MYCKLNPERTLLLDKLIRTTKSEFITFEIDSIFQIQLITADMSHMTLIKLESQFFDEFVNDRTILASISARKLYESNMKELEMKIVDNQRMVLEYQLKDAKHIKKVECLEADVFDLQFQIKRSIEVDGSSMKRVLGEMKGKDMMMEIGEKLRMVGGNVEIESINMNMNESKDKKIESKTAESKTTEYKTVEFKVDVEKLKSIMQITDQFYNCRFNFTEEVTPLNIMFESPEMTMSTFISTE